MKCTICPIPLVYAIRHKPTGHFLPMMVFTRNPRHTHNEPTPNCIPRLFDSEKNARLALNKWLRGAWVNPVYDPPNSPYPPHRWRPGLSQTRILSRKAEEMEIVTISMEVLSN